MHIVPGKSSNLKFGFSQTNKQTNKQKKLEYVNYQPQALHFTLRRFRFFKDFGKFIGKIWENVKALGWRAPGCLTPPRGP